MPTRDEVAIRTLIEARNEAIHAGHAEEAIAALSPDTVAYDLQPPLRFAGAAARDGNSIAQWLASWDGQVTIEISGLVIAIDGDLAVAHGLSNMRGVKREEGPINLWYRTTLGLKRTEGAWLIFHEHNSVPMRMNGSGMAATDLIPDDIAPA